MIDQILIELARKAGAELQARHWRIATAESCTGGLVGHLLTEIAGSSAYYMGGAVAYDNEVKHKLLGVAPETLDRAGAVSEQCAREMVAGARRVFGTEVAVAITGIAGPGGGTPEKPVGLVHLAVETSDHVSSERHLFTGDRSEIKQQSARRALELVIQSLAPVNALSSEP